MTAIRSDAPVTLVGGGPFDAADLAAARQFAPEVIAADGGLDTALALGITPRALIGDLDSVTVGVPEGVDIRHITEQDSTDFEKCLRLVDAPLCIGVGFLDGRLDHSLAAMHALIAYDARPVILLGAEDLVFATPRRWRAELPPGTRLSLFPLLPCEGLRSTGLRWPLDGLSFAAGTRIATSNEATAEPLHIESARPGMVTIAPKTCLPAIVASLAP